MLRTLDIEITPQSPHSVDVDDSLTIWCTALGLSSPTVQWYKGDKPVTPHADPYVQSFKVPTSYPRTTVYTCVASKFTGNINHTITVNFVVTVKGTATFCVYSDYNSQVKLVGRYNNTVPLGQLILKVYFCGLGT